MASHALSEIIYKQNSNSTATSPLRQKKFLSYILNILKSKDMDQINEVLDEMNQIREIMLLSLFKGAGRLRVAGDFKSTGTGGKSSNDPMDSTDLFLPLLLSIFPKTYLDEQVQVETNGQLIELGYKQLNHNFFNQSSHEKKGLIVGLSSVENSNVYLAGRGVAWAEEHEAKLMVAIEYLTALEGNVHPQSIV